jgi:hypothetical protein
MSIEEIRIRCLEEARLACKDVGLTTPESVVEAAEKFFKFVSKDRPAKPDPRDIAPID